MDSLAEDGVLHRLLQNEKRDGWRLVNGSLQNDPDVATYISGSLMRHAIGEQVGLVVMLDELCNDASRTLAKIMSHGKAFTADGQEIKLTWRLEPDSMGRPSMFMAHPGKPLKVIGRVTGPTAIDVLWHAPPTVIEFGGEHVPLPPFVNRRISSGVCQGAHGLASQPWTSASSHAPSKDAY